MCERIDDVELVLFESGAVSNLPSETDVQHMAAIAGQHKLTYTVHLPLDAQLGAAEEKERRESVQKCRRVMELTLPLTPLGWVVHLHGDYRSEPPSRNMTLWREQCRQSLRELTETARDPQLLCVETLAYDFSHLSGIIEDTQVSVCLDIGHLLVGNRSVEAHLDAWLHRTRVVHVHGVRDNGKDHCDMRYLPAGLLEDLAERLAALPDGSRRVVTMEVFGERDFEASMQEAGKRLRAWLK